MTHLAACPRLHRLTFGHREITGAEIKQLANWEGLNYLTLTHATITKEALEAMALLPSLVSLEIIASELSDETLAHLKLPDTVIHLGLKQNNISGPGLAEMSKRAQNLKTLGLEFNDLTNEALPDLVGFTTVENLYLSYCLGITDEGIASGALQKMKQLRELRLRGLKVTDASVEALSAMTFLEKLSVRSTGVTWDGIDKLKKAMPKTYSLNETNSIILISASVLFANGQTADTAIPVFCQCSKPTASNTTTPTSIKGALDLMICRSRSTISKQPGAGRRFSMR